MFAYCCCHWKPCLASGRSFRLANSSVHARPVFDMDLMDLRLQADSSVQSRPDTRLLKFCTKLGMMWMRHHTMLVMHSTGSHRDSGESG
jgi:hypothetical protein